VPSETESWIEKKLRPIFKNGWRHYARTLLELRPGELRLVLNSDLTEEDHCAVENAVAQHLRNRADAMRAEADAAIALAHAFSRECNERRQAVELAKIKDHDEFMEEFFKVCMPDWHCWEAA
jgi:hypothetical protein